LKDFLEKANKTVDVSTSIALSSEDLVLLEDIGENIDKSLQILRKIKTK